MAVVVKGGTVMGFTGVECQQESQTCFKDLSDTTLAPGGHLKRADLMGDEQRSVYAMKNVLDG